MTTQVYLCPTFGVGYQAFTSGGLPLNAGLIYTYIAGGTTPQATYTASDGNTANANPIVLNADGRTPAEIWLLAGQAYRFDVKDSLGNVLGSYDNISGVNDPSVAAPSGLLTGTAGTNTITATTSPVPTAYTSGTKYTLVPANTNTGATTLNIAGLGAKNVFAGGAALVGGELVSAVPVIIEYDGTQFNIVNGAPFVDTRPLVIGSADATKKMRFEVDGNTASTTRIGTVPNSDFNLGAPRSYLAGLTMSTAGSSATMSIAAGIARDSTNVADISLAASISKTTSAWAVGTGNGGLDTGSIANNTWYHFYGILRPDTGVTDVIFSTSASSPTLPSNYTYFRRIGSGRTNGSAQWTSFTQDGDYFVWATPVADVNATNPGASAVSRTLTVPTGVNVTSIVNWTLVTSGTATNGLISDLAMSDTAASASTANLGIGSSSTNNAAVQLMVRTNTSSQVRSRLSASGADIVLNALTIGWYDRRGRDS